jgi:methylmalonyl-CoA mutase cobalamin-binding subunit
VKFTGKGNLFGGKIWNKFIERGRKIILVVVGGNIISIE